MGTYDGNLNAMRLEIVKEGSNESYSLQRLKVWSFDFPIISIIFFDMYNYQNDPNAITTMKNVGNGNRDYRFFNKNNKQKKTSSVFTRN